MIIREYALDAADVGLVLADDDLIRLMSNDDARRSRDLPNLLVWRRAFHAQGLQQAMSAPSWSVDLIEGLQPPDWEWKIKTGSGETSTNSVEILSWAREAAGVEKPPSRNVVVTLPIRDYSDRESRLGNLDWWYNRLGRKTVKGGFATTLVRSILDVLDTATSAGSDLFVEQISVLLSKVETSPIASLTPTLHSDEYYGVRESAICSLLENGFNDLGGALFMPRCRMDMLWHMRPIDLNKIMLELTDEPLVVTGSGDVLIFDGMIGLDGNRSAKNGIPHISPDVAGRSARLAILMYHHRNR